MKRATALSPTELRRLDLWASSLLGTFGHHPILVGSVLRRRNYRDVDVRLVLDPNDPLVADEARLRLVNTALSVWAQQATGLPVDFQFQTSEEWALHTSKPRSLLASRWNLREIGNRHEA